MSFAHGQLLWLLLVLPPALAAFFWWSWRERQRLATRFIQARLLPGLLAGVSPARQKIRLACLVLTVALLLLALARPQWGFDVEEVRQRGLDILVAIDTSKSMLATDIAPNRLARAKLAALDLMQLAKSDRLGLVAFAGDAFLECPLTIDDTAFRQSVEALDVNTLPEGGTALAAAIRTALTAFKEGDNYKVLVLLTDGEDNDEGALAAAQNAAGVGLRIFTVGIGTAEGELLRITDAQGRTDYVRDEQGNVVKSHLNESLLQQIASATEGGFYLRLQGARTMDTLYERGLAPLPKSEGQEKQVKRYHERYHWPLAAAIFLLLVEMLLPERKREGRAGVLYLAATLVVLALPPGALGSPSSALRDYRAGKYDQSLKEYQRLLERKANDPQLQFNAGTAAYRERQFDEAAGHFNKALSAPDLRLQQSGYYNLGNTFYQLGERTPDPNKKIESWENAQKCFTNAVVLNTNDTDARFNYAFVTKKLEELKQQQQQQQSQQSQQQNKLSDQQEKTEQQNQPQEPKGSPSPQKPEESQQKQQPAQQPQNENPPQPQSNPSPPARSASGQEKKDTSERPENSEALTAHAMTPQEAQQLLDAQKGDETVLPWKPQEKPEHRQRTIKDW